jgi:hypothetical protein
MFYIPHLQIYIRRSCTKISIMSVAENWEAQFLDVIGIKVLRVFLFAIQSHLYKWISPPPLPLNKSGLKLVCNVNIVYGNLKSEISQDNAQKPQ